MARAAKAANPTSLAGGVLAGSRMRRLVPPLESPPIVAAFQPVGSAPWIDVDVRPRGWSLADVAYRDGTFVVVGSRDGGARMLAAISADGATWTEVAIP